MASQGVISSQQLNAQSDGSYTVTITNPLAYTFKDIGNKGDTLGGGSSGANCVLSCQPDGTWQTRPNGTAGPWEKCKRSGNILTFTPTSGVAYTLIVGA